MSSPPSERKLRVWQRDKWRCRYCGEKLLRKAEATVDHVIPRSRGGSNKMSNLVTACVPCNQGKADKLPWDAAAQAGSAMQMAFVDAQQGKAG